MWWLVPKNGLSEGMLGKSTDLLSAFFEGEHFDGRSGGGRLSYLYSLRSTASPIVIFGTRHTTSAVTPYAADLK